MNFRNVDARFLHIFHFGNFLMLTALAIIPLWCWKLTSTRIFCTIIINEMEMVIESLQGTNSQTKKKVDSNRCADQVLKVINQCFSKSLVQNKSKFFQTTCLGIHLLWRHFYKRWEGWIYGIIFVVYRIIKSKAHRTKHEYDIKLNASREENKFPMILIFYWRWSRTHVWNNAEQGDMQILHAAVYW